MGVCVCVGGGELRGSVPHPRVWRSSFPGPSGLESFKPFPAHPRLGEVCVNERERPGGGVESAGV